MGAATIVMIIIGVICIIASFILVKNSDSGEITEGVPAELSKKDKDHIKGLVDKYVDEYTKTKKDSIKSTFRTSLESLMSQVQRLRKSPYTQSRNTYMA